MRENETSSSLSQPLRMYMALVTIGGMAWLAYLAQRVAWEPSTLGEMGLFILLIVAAGSFPLRVGPRVKTDVTAAALFGSAIILDPGVAALGATVGVITYTVLLRFWGEKIRLPWHQYAFNAGATALFVGVTSLIFHGLVEGNSLLTPGLIPAAACYYLINTVLVSGAVGLQLGLNPVRFWWMGTKENGLAELSLFAFGILGAVAYRESQWAVVALFIPVGIIYFAFSRLAQNISQLEKAEADLRKAKDGLETRVEERTAELSTATELLRRSRRRVVNAQEELRKIVAQQLHGPVQNRLLVATHWLNTAQNATGEDIAKCAEHISKAAHLIDEINQGDLRAAVRRLHPSLIRMSLQASLRSLADQFNGSFKVEVQVAGKGPDSDELWRAGLPEELRLAIYRISEEALSNVLKHAMATTVDLRLDQPNEGCVTMTIQDNGCGFDVESTTPGFGLLSIQDYCGAVGGALEVVSSMGRGTTIAVRFPVPARKTEKAAVAMGVNGTYAETIRTTPSANGTGTVHAKPREVSGHKEEAATTLLIVDDQPDFCGLVEELLRPYREFQVVGEANDGLSALRLVEELEPDVVLLDLEMPGLHGLETAAEIHTRFPAVKVVLMSAYHQREYIQVALQAGASDFIHKAEFSVNRLRDACRDKMAPRLEYVPA